MYDNSIVFIFLTSSNELLIPATLEFILIALEDV